MPIIVLETMRLWACALHRGPTKAKSTVRTMSRLRLWDQEAGRSRQLKREVCFLLPHEVQTGGTLFAAGFPDFFHWFVSEDKQPTPEENGLCMHVGKHIHTGQPTWHSLTFKVEPTFPEWASYKDLVCSGQRRQPILCEVLPTTHLPGEPNLREHTSFTAVSPWPSPRHSATTGLFEWVSCFSHQTGGRASPPSSDPGLLRAGAVLSIQTRFMALMLLGCV